MLLPSFFADPSTSLSRCVADAARNERALLPSGRPDGTAAAAAAGTLSAAVLLLAAPSAVLVLAKLPVLLLCSGGWCGCVLVLPGSSSVRCCSGTRPNKPTRPLTCSSSSSKSSMSKKTVVWHAGLALLLVQNRKCADSWDGVDGEKERQLTPASLPTLQSRPQPHTNHSGDTNCNRCVDAHF
jgi:hypothetical protein